MTDAVNELAELIWCYPNIISFGIYEKDHLAISYFEGENSVVKEFKSDKDELAIIHLLMWVENNLTHRSEYTQLEQKNDKIG